MLCWHAILLARCTVSAQPLPCCPPLHCRKVNSCSAFAYHADQQQLLRPSYTGHAGAVQRTVGSAALAWYGLFKEAQELGADRVLHRRGMPALPAELRNLGGCVCRQAAPPRLLAGDGHDGRLVRGLVCTGAGRRFSRLPARQPDQRVAVGYAGGRQRFLRQSSALEHLRGATLMASPA